MSEPANILLIEHDRQTAMDIHHQMIDDGFKVDLCLSASEGYSFIRRHHYDLIIMNAAFPDEDLTCNPILKLIGQQFYKNPIILLCDDVSMMPSSYFASCHIFSFFQKPINYRHFRSTINRALEEASSTTFREDLLAMFSHDIKNPLASIIGYSSIILSGKCGEINDQVRNYLGKISSKGRKILLLTDDFLTSCKIDANKLVLNKISTDINSIIDNVLMELEILITEKNLSVNFQRNKLPEIPVDPLEIERVFSNLIFNAIKFAYQDGSLSTETKYCPPEDEWKTPFVEINISNNGPMISPEELPYIFFKYKRIKGNDTASGFGLGLYIVKFIIEEHNGTISVTSNETTTFSIRLPIN